ncbi:MAG: glycosyltransferase family 4 protein, partial [Anaerolineae bacterium]
PEGSLIKEVRRRGVPLTIMPQLRREVSPANDMVALVKLARMMRDGRFHIVHTHSSKAGVLGRAAARLGRVPIVVHTVHGWSFHDQMSPRRRHFYVALEKLGRACGDATIVVAARDIEKGLAQGIGGSPADYHVIRSGIELDRFGHPRRERTAVRAELGVPEESLLVGCVTRLSPQKSPLTLVELFARVAAARPQTRFVVVGDGPLRGEMEARLAAVGLTERVTLTGLRRDVPELMAAFDLFVLTSLWEGLPRVLPQAMASGLPVVCTAADGSAEIVQDGVNGFLVERGDVAAMATRVGQLLADGKLRQRMGENGRVTAQTFSARQMVDDIHRLYQQLLVDKSK